MYTYHLRKYNRSNQSTCIDQKPVVRKGQRIQKGDVIADSSAAPIWTFSTWSQCVMCFMSWEGGNYEDALVLSE